MEAAWKIGMTLFGLGGLLTFGGWLPALAVSGSDAAIATTLIGLCVFILGAVVTVSAMICDLWVN